MQGLKPFEDTIYIDSVPVIDYKSGTDGVFVQYKVVEQKKIYALRRQNGIFWFL